MRKIALDSNVFIYNFEANPAYVKFTDKIFKKLINKTYSGITSVISIIETLAYPMSEKKVEEIKEKFKTIPNCVIYNINEEISLEAARIRRIYGFRLPDSIQLATALEGKASIFITNDKNLKKFKELKVKLIKEF